MYSDFLYKNKFFRYSFKLPRNFIKAYVVGTDLNCPDLSSQGNSDEYHNVCFYKGVGNITRNAMWILRNSLIVRLWGMCGNLVEYGIQIVWIISD